MGYSCTKAAADKLAALKKVLCVGLPENSFINRGKESGQLFTHIIEHNAEDERDGGITGQVTVCIDDRVIGNTPFIITGDGDLFEGCRFMMAAEGWLREELWPEEFSELVLDPEME